MAEQALLFGPSKAMLGIITHPVEVTDRPYPNVILLNAGLLHRIGPNRLYVKLARRLSERGVTTLRFDLSGIGDSPQTGGQEPLIERRLVEIKSAMDLVASKTDNNKFILGGLCSGAECSFAGALKDPRVVGMVLMEPFPYRTRGYYLRHYGARLIRWQSWRNVLTGNHLIWKRMRGKEETPAGSSHRSEDYPPAFEVEQMYQSLIERGVRSLVVYAGVWNFNHRRQFGEFFPSLALDSNIQLEYFRQANHTFVLLRNQDRLIASIERWLVNNSWSDENQASHEEPSD